MRAVLAIDQGTTGSTCLVITEDGRICGRGYREITQYFPEPGWVEHDADEIFVRTMEAARDAIAQSAAGGILPDAIGITNQRETVLLWDRATSVPIGRAIVWQDRRTAARCAALTPQRQAIAAATGRLPVAWRAVQTLWQAEDAPAAAQLSSAQTVAQVKPGAPTATMRGQMKPTQTPNPTTDHQVTPEPSAEPPTPPAPAAGHSWGDPAWRDVVGFSTQAVAGHPAGAGRRSAAALAPS